MARQALSYSKPLVVAIADKSTANNPGEIGTYAWSTTLQALVVWDGTRWQRLGNAPDPSVYGLTDLSLGNYYATAISGGEQGVNTGFGISILYVQDKSPSAYGENMLATCWSNATYTSGWQIQSQTVVDGTWYVRAQLGNNAGGSALPTSCILTSLDLGQLQVYTMVYAPGAVSQYFNRDLYGPPQALASYAPPVYQPMYIGRRAELTSNASNASVFGVLGFRGTPSAANVASLADYVRANGDFPKAMAGVLVTHRYSFKDTLTKKKLYVPVKLSDATTAAAVDTMTRVGAPKARRIDMHRAGRTIYGLHGFDTSAHLTTIDYNYWPHRPWITGSVQGFWYGWRQCVQAQSGTAGPHGVIAGDFLVQGTGEGTGWGVVLTPNNAAVQFRIGNSTAWFTVDVPILPGELGQVLAYLAVFDGLNIKLYAQGQLRAIASVPAGFVTAGYSFMMGTRPFATYPPRNVEVYGGVGGHAVPTEADITTWFQEVERTDRIPAIPNKTRCLYDFTLDMEPYGGRHAPFIKDRVGTANLDYARSAGEEVRVARGDSIMGWKYGANYRTAAGRGLQGVATGFWAHVLFRHEIYLNYPRILFGCSNVGFQGWNIMFNNAGNGSLTPMLGNNTVMVGTSSYTPGLMDIRNLSADTLLHGAFTYDGATLTPWFNGIKGIGVSVSNFTPSTSLGTYFGTSNNGTYSAYGMGILGGGGGLTLPTDAEMLSLATSSRTQGKVATVAGKTTHSWDLKQDILDTAGRVPTRFKERVNENPYDDMTHIGSMLEPSVRTDRVWSYETAPIFYGIQNLSTTSYYEALTDFRGSPAGFWVAVLCRIDNQVNTSQIRSLLTRQEQAGMRGFDLRTYGNHSQFGFYASGDDGVGRVSLGSVGAGRVGKLFLAVGVVTSTLTALYLRRVLQGAGTANTGYSVVTNAATPLRVGNATAFENQGANDISIFGWALGYGVPLQPEISTLFSNVMAKERMVGIPNKTDILVDVGTSVRANGGTLPATLYDLQNNLPFTRVGTPSLTTHTNRSWGG